MKNYVEKQKKSVREGSMTVYAALTLLLLVSLFLALFTGIRRNTVRLETELITDISLDCILAEYHREMLNQYNLFFVDTSYGQRQPSLTAVKEHLEGFLKRNLPEETLLTQMGIIRDLLKMELKEVQITGVRAATDEDGDVFRKRAAQAVKDEIGLSYLELLKGWLETIQENGFDEKNMEEEKKKADEELESYNGMEIQDGEDWVTIEIENPTTALEAQRRKGILYLVVEDVDQLSDTAVDLSGLISERSRNQGSNTGNLPLTSGVNFTEKLLFQEYIMRYTGNYLNPPAEGLLQYQTEYVIAGKDSDIGNLKSVVHRICGIREAANVFFLLTDQEKQAEAEALALLLSGAVMLPELKFLFQTAIILAWAYVESIHDVKCLLEGKRVPLLKDSISWYSDLESILGELGKDADLPDSSEETGLGLGYEDYLRILLVLGAGGKQTFRMMDLVEMNIRQTPGNSCFRIDGCIDALQADVWMESCYGSSVELNRTKAY